jgi:hypothetical protein
MGEHADRGLAALLLLNRPDLSVLVLPVLLPLIPWRARAARTARSSSASR